MKLNLACGGRYEEGFVNIDRNDSVKVDIKRDIMRGLPFGDGCVSEIKCEHFIEHLNSNDFIFLFNESWRVLVEGGVLKIKAPYYKGKWAFIDPTHIRLITEFSFDFFMNKDYNSVTAGVTGWYEPVFIKIDGGELIAEFKKVLEPKNFWNVKVGGVE